MSVQMNMHIQLIKIPMFVIINVCIIKLNNKNIVLINVIQIILIQLIYQDNIVLVIVNKHKI